MSHLGVDSNNKCCLLRLFNRLKNDLTHQQKKKKKRVPADKENMVEFHSSEHL